ncbi:DUF433 domain-containing protein [Brevundimonas staleyi]|uniref:DUF433 domain-containing protein n=1 Tax=Brevundimonas staleyi TaxID=74326 RepID=A0ABW0FQ73_9CAUL
MEHPRISRDPKIMVGKPCIKGTRITVEHVLREVAGGSSIELIANEYLLDRDDVVAAIVYASDFIRHESLIAA